MAFADRLKYFGVSKALDYLERDPDSNLPRLMEWVDKFAGDRLSPDYQEVFHRALSDSSNNWYRLIKSMYSDIDNRVLKKIFENFILHAHLLSWPRQNAEGGWPQGRAPWAVVIDPAFPCRMDCKGCGAAIYGVRPDMQFDRLDEEIEARKARGTYLYIFSAGNPLERQQEIIALCNKQTECVFAAFTPPHAVDVGLVKDMLRVCNLFPAIQVEGPEATEEALRAMALLKEWKMPFGVACRCTADNADQVATEGYYDRVIGWGAKFCWYFTCPAAGEGVPAAAAQLTALHQRVRAFRKTKPLLTLDFWDRPSPSATAPQTEGIAQEGGSL